jgi:uncharacterized membrane protein YfcA
VDITWIAGAGVLAIASGVFGLTGFGIGLVALSLLPLLMPPATVVPLITIYGAIFALAMTLQLRRDVVWSRLAELIVGTLLGTPVGIWVLATLPGGLLKRLIGLMLIALVVVEWSGAYPKKLSGRVWGVGAGILAGLLGGAIGMPGPPVVLYTVAQGWSPRAIKATLQAFFLVNQAAILSGYWWADLVTHEIVWLAASYALPASAGFALGLHLFTHVDQRLFRRLMFGLLLGLGLLLVLYG